MLAVWRGIIPPVRDSGVTLNRGGAGAAECANSFNSRFCYRHAVIVNIMDDEHLPTALFLRYVAVPCALGSAAQAAVAVLTVKPHHLICFQSSHGDSSSKAGKAHTGVLKSIHHFSLLLHLFLSFFSTHSSLCAQQHLTSSISCSGI